MTLKVSRMFMMLTKNVSNYCNKHSIVNAPLAMQKPALPSLI